LREPLALHSNIRDVAAAGSDSGVQHSAFGRRTAVPLAVFLPASQVDIRRPPNLVECRDKVVAYITDTEHTARCPDDNVLSLIDHADVMIYDATYTEEELPSHIGWGHSTWKEGIKLADAARAKTLVLFHHAPEHDDAFMDRVAAKAQAARPGTLAAKEGMVLRL
jgi:ribonuclease BN (tRNA processing enzyme)